MMPKISIVTPCFNCSEYIKKTYDSVQAQTFQDWEWILVDDCSTDNTFALIRSFSESDPRIKCFKNPTNSGASVSRNRGIDEAQGEYIAFLDADDLWNIEKLAEQLSFMEKHQSEFSYHNYEIVDFAGVYLKSMFSPNELDKSVLEIYNPLLTSSVMMKKQSIGNIRFDPRLRRRQDYIFWYEVMKVTKCALNVGIILGSYRVGNKNSLSSNKLQNIPIQWNIYRNEFKLSLIQSMKSIFGYATHGIKKYFL